MFPEGVVFGGPTGARPFAELGTKVSPEHILALL